MGARPDHTLGHSRRFGPVRATSAIHPIATNDIAGCPKGRVEDGRGSLGHLATLRFPSPLIEPDVPD